MTVFNGEVLFDGTDTSGKLGLWVTNGSAAGTHELTGIFNVDSSFIGLNPRYMMAFGQEVLFNGENASGQSGLWATNGTGAGTHELTGISGAYTGAEGLTPFDLTVFRSSGIRNGEEVLFDGLNASDLFVLWVTDGTTAGTHEVTGISGGLGNGLNPPDMTVFQPSTQLGAPAEVAFNGHNASFQFGLWVTDGTAAGTHEVTGISGASSNGLNPAIMTTFGHEVLFNGINAGGNHGLWATNGTTAGTHELTGISGAFSNGINPSELTVFNSSEVLFNGENASGQHGLWVSDGTPGGTHELTGIIGRDSNGIDPSALTLINGEVLFDGTDVNNKQSLWETDGTVVGTHELAIGGAESEGLAPDTFTFVTLTIPPSDNFTSGNTSDILFRNNSTGDTWYEAMNNGAFAGWNQIGGSNTSYGVVGTGDFSGRAPRTFCSATAPQVTPGSRRSATACLSAGIKWVAPTPIIPQPP
jgi:ELWxxDGT repeat protein